MELRMATCRKIGRILWKNWLLRRRHYVVTVFELILPILLAIVFCIFMDGKRNVFSENYEEHFKIYPEKNILQDTGYSYGVLYSPDTEIAKDLLKYIPNYSSYYGSNSVRLIGVKDEETIERMIYERGLKSYRPPLMDAVVFVGKNLNESIPNTLHYKIRIGGGWDTLKLVKENYFMDDYSLNTRYINSNNKFLIYQHLVAIRYAEILRKQDGLLSQINITVQKFPVPPQYSTNYSFQMKNFLSFYITLCFILTIPTIILRIVKEKESGIRELMKSMGFSIWIQRFGWFVSNFVVMAIGAMIIVVSLYIRTSEKSAIVYFSDPLLVYIITLLYVTSAICFCFFIASVFSRPSIATITGMVIWIFTCFVPYFILFDNYQNLSFNFKMALGLFPNMALAAKIITEFEVKYIGIQWSNLNEPSVVGDNLTMIHVILMNIVDIVLYSLLTWYFDHVLPGKYGEAKSWNFLFTKMYWCRNKLHVDDESPKNEDKGDFEVDPNGKSNPVIVIKKLTKTFSGPNKFAVDNLSLKAYEGQITVLLGHKGAGKTTTISMLTGMYSPTSGTAIINGYDIRTEMDAARNDLGLCPQHNMLFEKLTVREHLIFFGSLKKGSGESLTKEVDSLLNKLQLWEKRNDLAGNLLGGMKRKLNLGIALVGGSKIVILDEPTSGMDPEARRAIWDLLQEYRAGRCILLSTHFMEEADVLGDRIAIMARGQIECCGTPLFLKKRYGAGYHLTLNITNNDEVLSISNMIRQCVPTSYLENTKEGELSFVLPPEESQGFVSLFGQLETNAEALGIKNYSLLVTTLEDVFLKGVKTADEENNQQYDSIQRFKLIENGTLVNDSVTKNTGRKLWLQQCFGLLLKRFYYARKRPVLLIAQIFVPVITSIGLILILNSNDAASTFSFKEPSLLMDISQYGSTVSFTNYDKSDEQIASLGKFYELSFPSITTVDRVNDSLDYLEEFGQHNFVKNQNPLVTGADFSPVNTSAVWINIWYNYNFYHSLALGLNLVHNAIVKSYTKNQTHSIFVENAPLPEIPEYYIKRRDTTVVPSIIIGVFFPIALSILMTSFIILPIHERVTKSKHLQFMTGINGFGFWNSSFLWDFLANFISLCFVLVVIVAMDNSHYLVGQGKLGIVFFILLAYICCYIPFLYLISFVFRKPARGFAIVTTANLIFGMVISFLIYLKLTIPEHWLLNLFPNYSVTIVLTKFVSIVNKDCQKLNSSILEIACRQPDIYTNSYLFECCPPDVCGKRCLSSLSYLDPRSGLYVPGIEYFITPFIVGLVFFLLLLPLESSLIRRIGNYLYTVVKNMFYVNWSPIGRVQKVSYEKMNEIDDDVNAAKNRVQDLLDEKDRISTDLFIVHNLVKEFGKLVAVDNLNFAVAQAECFGLLGTSGAGKTTTFQMLTEDIPKTKGNVIIRDFFTPTGNRSKYLENIGYCPQLDALLDHLTGRELLTVFAHLHGISRLQIKRTVDSYLINFGLVKHADEVTFNYSTGNKRKLCLAIAFLDQKPVVILDEPTTGVDPATKKEIWGIIKEAIKSGTSIILASQSVEECKALCSRMAIMVNGRFQCIGGIQYLENKFSQGFTILAKMKSSTAETNKLGENVKKELQRYIEEKFPSALLIVEHEGLIHYQVMDVNIKWTYLFSIMEEAKARFKLEDYFISGANLDQIFLSFAKTQKSSDENGQKFQIIKFLERKIF